MTSSKLIFSVVSILQPQITSATTGISHLTYHYYRHKNPFKISYPIYWHQEEGSVALDATTYAEVGEGKTPSFSAHPHVVSV